MKSINYLHFIKNTFWYWGAPTYFLKIGISKYKVEQEPIISRVEVQRTTIINIYFKIISLKVASENDFFIWSIKILFFITCPMEYSNWSVQKNDIFQMTSFNGIGGWGSPYATPGEGSSWSFLDPRAEFIQQPKWNCL